MFNRVKTLVLMAVLTALFLCLGQVLGGNAGAAIALLFAAVMNFGVY